MKNITITNNKTLFTYHGESLDLMNPPDISNHELYALYNNLINNTLTIYGGSRADGSIPVFWTKIDNTNKLSRIADQNSTLRTLDNNQSYYIVMINNSSFPLPIPSPINLQDLSARSCNICIGNNIDCCSPLSIQSGNYSNIILSDEYSTNIYVTLSGLKPDTKYNYQVNPILSNWPAKMYPLSGFIERSGPTDKENNLTANLEFMFSYISKDASGNIQKNIDTKNNNQNIFSILDFNVWQDGCDSILKDSINISSNSLGSLTGIDVCPNIKFDNNTYFVNTSGAIKLNILYSGIDITKNNYYYVSSNNANWPSRISSTSGKITPEYIYRNTSSGKLYGSGLLSLGFKFSDTAIPTAGFSNLYYNLDSNYQENFIKDNIYCSLDARVTTPEGCISGLGTTTVICNDCLPNNEYNCINNATINIYESSDSYPIDLVSSRPGAEKTIPIQCCHDDRQIIVDLNNLCPNELYDYKFSVTPNDALLSSISGYIGVPSGDGQIGTLVNIGDNEAVNLTCTVTHRDTKKSISDSIILRCEYCRWNKIKDLTEAYNSRWNNDVPSYASSSLDGSTMIVAIPSGYMYRSTDNGVNWERLSQNGAKIWSSVSCGEHTGSNIWFFTTGDYESSSVVTGLLYTSTNNGDSLTEIAAIPSGFYSDVASTDTVSTVVLAHISGIKTSTDFGSSWNDITIPYRKRWNNISISNDANKILLSYSANVSPTNWASVTSINTSGAYLRSMDGGATWEEKKVPFISGTYTLIKYSKDGSTLVAVNPAGGDEFIYVSNDDGESWFPKQYETLSLNVNNFYMSNNGQRIVLLGSNKIYKSKDGGDTWTNYTITGSNDILCMAHSSDMSIMTTVSQNSNIYSLHLYNCPADRA